VSSANETETPEEAPPVHARSQRPESPTSSLAEAGAKVATLAKSAQAGAAAVHAPPSYATGSWIVSEPPAT
jgi:hypothetical protein